MTPSSNDSRKDDAMSNPEALIEDASLDAVTPTGNPPFPREIRKRLGMMQDEFAEALGVSSAELVDWEEGRAEPGPQDCRVLYAVLRTTVAVARKANRSLPARPPAPELIIEAPDRCRRMSVSDVAGVQVSVTPEQRRIIRDAIKSDEVFSTERSDENWFKISEFAQYISYSANKLEDTKADTDRLRAERALVAHAILIGQLACEALFGRTIGLLIARVPVALKDLDAGHRRNPLLTPPPPAAVDPKTGNAKGGQPSRNIPERTRQNAVAACVQVLMDEYNVSEISARNTVSGWTRGAFGTEIKPSTIGGWKAEAESDLVQFKFLVDAAKRHVYAQRTGSIEARLRKWLISTAKLA